MWRLWKLFPGSVIGHSQIPQVLKCTRSLQLHNTQVKRFRGIDIFLLCLNATQYNSAIENGKYDYTGVTVREFITGVEFQMQLNLGLHFDCFIWAVTILRSQRYSQDITLIGSSIISTIFSFEHIKFRDKHQGIKILLKILLSTSSSIHAFMTAIMTMTMTMVMTMMIKMKMSIFVLMIISSLHSFYLRFTP